MTPEPMKPLPQLCADIVDQEIASLQRFLGLADLALMNDVVPGSGIDRLTEWLRALPRAERLQRKHSTGLLAVIDSSNGAIRRLLANALDHAQTLSGALRSGRPVAGSSLTLCRGALEAVLQICYVLDPNAAPRTAILRALAYEAATIEGNEATGDAFGDMARPEQLRQARESVDEFHRWLTRSGFSRGHARSPRQSTWVGVDDEHVNLRFNVTDAMRDYLFGEGYYYSVLSGAAHSRGWLLATSYLPDEAGHTTTEDQQVLIATVPLLDASETLATSVGFWTGLDHRPIVQKTHMRRRALLAGRGHDFSPMSLDDYRSQRGPSVMGRAFMKSGQTR